MSRLLLLLVLLAATATAQAGQFFVLTYHDVRKEVATGHDNDPFAVSRKNLARHFAWLKANDYRVVSLDDVLAARAGTRPLPEKAVLLTFDDGEASLYTEVFPLLKLHGYPAVAALVTSWLEVPAGEDVQFGNDILPRSAFITWEQAREMRASGLVEFVSQSHDLHRDIVVSPLGTRQPAASSRAFNNGSHESLTDYYHRVHNDLVTSRDVLVRRVGSAPRALVWPYGAHSNVGWQAAQSAGYELSLTLDNTRISDPAAMHIGRELVMGNPDAAELAANLLPAPGTSTLRAIQVDLDYVYDADPAQQARNLDALIERVRQLNVSTVYLQAFADPDGNGAADALYFPNRRLPVRSDLFTHAAWQLGNRAGARVFAWLPVSAFQFADIGADARVAAAGRDNAQDPPRLSIFRDDVRAAVRDVYDDLGRHAYVDGILFHDDAFLRADEDVSPAAVAWYRANGLPAFDPQHLPATAEERALWTALKSQALVDFTAELASALRAHRPELRTARNLFARAASEAGAEADFAQSLQRFSTAYDHIALMAMPRLEQAPDEQAFLSSLVAAVRASGVDSSRVVFELQARDWRDSRQVPVDQLAGQMDDLLAHDMKSYGYYPDDFLHNQPPLEGIRPVMSLADFPWTVSP